MSLRRIGVSEPLARRVKVYETTLGERALALEAHHQSKSTAFLDFVAARLRFSRDFIDACSCVRVGGGV